MTGGSITNIRWPENIATPMPANKQLCALASLGKVHTESLLSGFKYWLLKYKGTMLLNLPLFPLSPQLVKVSTSIFES